MGTTGGLKLFFMACLDSVDTLGPPALLAAIAANGNRVSIRRAQGAQKACPGPFFFQLCVFKPSVTSVSFVHGVSTAITIHLFFFCAFQSVHKSIYLLSELLADSLLTQQQV